MVLYATMGLLYRFSVFPWSEGKVLVMGKKFRRFCKGARGPLAWILSLILVWQMFPAQGMAYALEEAAAAIESSQEAPVVVVEDEASEPEVALVDGEPAAAQEAPVEGGEPSDGEEVVPEEAPAVEPGEASEGEPEGEPEDLPEVEPEGEPTEEPSRGAEGEPEAGTEPEPTRATENAWTVTFYNRDAEVYRTVEVTKGQAIGDQLPDTIARDDYDAYWAVGEIRQGGQGQEIHVTGDRIDSTFIPTEDISIVPDYDKIEYTITFYGEDQTTVVATKTVTADTSYCLNDIPTVPAKAGSVGTWVYDNNGETAGFNNTISAQAKGDSTNRTLSVWAHYDKNVFTVTYVVDGDTYETDTYYMNDTLTLPADPVVEGKDFLGWYVGETEYVGGESVTSDLTLTAEFEDQYFVNFVTLNDDGTESERLSQYFRSAGEPIDTMPQDPFVAGKVFEKWVKATKNADGTYTLTDVEVTAETVVNDSFTAVAVFRKVEVYYITAEYYYVSTTTPGKEVIFNTDLLEVEAHELPYTITAPASTKTSSDEVAGAPVYYPETPTAEVKLSDFNAENKVTVRFEYVPYTAVYDYVYYLKNLDGNGYTEIERTSDVHGVLNSYVTPDVKNYDYAVLELAEGAIIETTGLDGQPKQELPVYYTRKNFQLTYETNGGSYVPGLTVPYGTTVALPAENPTRDGYTFEGWYSDEALTQRVSGSVTVNEDTTIYAKWTGNTVSYTIVYMLEEYDNATGTTSYVYDNSRTASGQVGTTVYASSAPDLTGNQYRGYERDTAWDQTSSVTIAADGSSVLVVHYKLIRYTLVFNLNRSTGRITMNGQTYSGSDYRIENVVLGQDVSSMWPASSSEVYASDRYFDGWTGASGTYITKRYELIWDNVANANNSHVMTFTASWDTDSADRDARYWLQQPDGTWAVADEYTQTGLNTTNLGPKNIDGYTQHNGNASRPNNTYPASGNTDVQVWVDEYTDTYTDNGGHTSQTPSQGERTVTRTVDGMTITYTFDHAESYQQWDIWHFVTRYRYVYTATIPGHNTTVQKYVYNFYYDRAQYMIEYFFGNTLLETKNNIYFEADISGSTYNYVPAKPENTSTIDYSDYTWGGWYEDAAFQTPYAFDTMPGHNVALYAKWNAPEFEVNFVMDGGTPAAETQTVTKYERASKPENPIKTGYTFEGWFTTADGDVLFDWNTQITADTTIYAHWSRDTLSYTVHYVDEDGNAVAPDKIVTNPNFVVDQVVTEQAIAVAGYRPNVNSQTLKLSGTESENVITFIYSAKADTTSYTVKYVIDPSEYGSEDDLWAVAADRVVEDVPGDTASVIELAAAVDYTALRTAHPELEDIEFYPDAVEKTLVLTADEEANVFYFYYTSYKHATVTVHFVDMDGNPIASDDVQTLKVGKTFTLSRTPVSGWELNRAVEGTAYEGTVAGTDYKITEATTANGLEFTIFYQKKVTVTANSASQQYNGSELKLPSELSGQVTVEGLPEGESLTGVSFTYADTDNATNDGRINAGVATVTPKNAQTNAIHAENYYAFRYISGTLTVTPINVTVRIEPDRWVGAPYTGEEYLTGFTNPGKTAANGADYVMISHEGYAALYREAIWNMVTSLDNVKEGGAGLGYYVVAEKDVDDYTYNLALTADDLPNADGNYSVSLYVRPGRLQILPAELTVTTGSAEKAYDGAELTNDEASLSGVVEADQGKITVTATGSITDPGEVPNTYEIDWGGVNPDNYTIKEELGTLKVTKATLTITVKDKTATFNGEEQSGYGLPETITGTGNAISETEYTVTGLAKGDVLNVTYTPDTQTNAGTYSDGAFGTVKVMRGDEDVTENYNITTTPGTLTIEPASVTLTASSGTETYDGTEKTVTGFTSSVEGLTFEGVSASGSGTNSGEYDVAFTGVTVNETKDSTGNYVVTEVVPGKLTITKATLTITAKDQTYTYNGSAQGPAGNYTSGFDTYVTVEGLQGSDALSSITLAGSQTNAGTYTDEIVPSNAVVGAATNNYDIAYVKGDLTINKAELTITAKDQTYTYNGSAQGPAGTYDEGLDTYVTVTGLQGTDKLTRIVLTGSQTNAGTYTDEIVPSGAFVGSRTDNYNITYVKGDLTINKAELTITAKDQTYTYNGSAQGPAGTYDEGHDTYVTVTGLKGGDALTSITLTGSKTDVGTYEKEIVPSEAQVGENTGNYTIVYVEGDLTIDPKKVTITADDASQTYNGSALTEDGFTATDLEEGDTHTFTVVMTGDSTITNVGTKPNVIATVDGVAVTPGTEVAVGNYLVTTANGTLTVNPKTVTITAKDANKAYDGNPLTQPEFTATDLEEGDTHTFTVVMTEDSTITNVGEKPNVIATVDGVAVTTGTATAVGNYMVTTANGTLTITKDKSALVITSATNGWTYDGSLHKDETYTVTYGGETVEADSTGTVFTLSNGDVVTITPTASGVTNVSDNASNNNTYTYTITNGTTDTTGNYESVAANVGTLTINPKAVTITANSDEKTYNGSALTNGGFTATDLEEGDSHTFTVVMTAGSTVTHVADSPTGNVIATVDGVAVTTGTATAVGNYLVTTADGELKITPATLTVVTESAGREYNGEALTADGSISGFVNNETATFTVTGSRTEVGKSDNTYTLTWDGTAVQSDYKLSETIGELEVTANTTEIVVSSESKSWTYDGAEHTYYVYTVKYGDKTYHATATDSATVTIEETDDVVTITPAASAKVTHVADGTVANAFTYELTNAGQYSNVSKTEGNLSVTPATLTIVTESDSKEYDGTALTAAGTATFGETETVLTPGQDVAVALAGTDSITVKVTGTQTQVGSSENKYEITWGNVADSDYTVAGSKGTLEVKKSTKELKVESADGSWTYDGSEHVKHEYTVTYGTESYDVTIAEGAETGTATLSTGDVVTITPAASAKVTHVADGTVANAFTYEVTHSDQYANQAKAEGELTVTPATLTIKTNTASKEYDGTALTAPGTIDGFIGEETATFTVTGTITEVGGPVDNTYSLVWDGTAVESDYELDETIGTLTVTASTKELKVESADGSWTYDGSEHVKHEYTVTYGTESYDVTIAEGAETGTATLSTGDVVTITPAASAKVTHVADGTVANAFTYEVTHSDQYANQAKAEGELTVTPAAVTITAQDYTFAYDGSAHAWDKYDVEGLVGDDAITAVVEGTITFPSESPVDNVVKSHEFTTGDPNNYDVKYVNGQLTMTNATYEITITAASDEWTYDGKAHENTEVTVTAGTLATGDTLVATAAGSVTDVADTAAGNNPIAAGYKVMHGTEDVTANYAITAVDGTLTINPKDVTFTGESATKTYTGSEIELTDVTVEGIVNGQTHNVTYSAKGTEVGEYTGTITAVADVRITDADGTDVTANYDITTTPGKLTIEQTDEQLTVTLDDAENKYDGKAHAIETAATTNAKSGTTTIEYSKDGTTWTTDLSTLTATNVSDSCTIQVRATNPNYKNTATDTAELKITPRNVTLTSADGEKQYDGTPLVKNAQTDITVGGDGFVAGEGATYNITGSQTEVGESKNTFSYTLNEGTLAENYVFASTPGTLKVTKSTAELSVASADGEWTYDGSAHTKHQYTVTYGEETIEGTEGQTEFTLSTGDKLTVTPATTATITNAADSTVDNAFTWTVENESFYTKGEDSVGTLTVNPKDVTISTGSAEKKYDGTPLTKDEATIDGLVEGESVTLKATGSQTEVGSSKNTYSITWDKAAETNYKVTDALGTLEVTSTDAKVTLTAASDEQVYNGQALVNAEVTATGLPEGITATATASGSQTNVGSSKNVVNDGYVFKDAAGNDVTKNFTNVEKVDGTLEVTPAPVTITTGSAEKPYDGTPLTESTATITGLVNNETATVTATGAQTEVGSSKNTYSIDWGTTDAKNYEVTEKLGTLEVTRNTAEVTLTAPSDTKVYDGTALTCDGTGEKKVTATGLPEGFTVEATASGSQTNAGKSDNVVNSGWVIKDASGADKTANFTNVTTEKGTLEVTKRPVTLKSATLSREYNGAALINGSTPLEIEEGWVEGEGATYTFTRSQTIPGSTDNVFTYKLNEGTLENNYAISVSYGSLIVTNRESKYEITLVANSGEYTYDGKEHSAVGVETDKFTFDGVEYTVSGFTTENPAQTNAGTYTNNISAENGFKVTDPQGNDVSSEFKVTPKNGELVISKRTVTLTSADGEKVYDGTPLTNMTVTGADDFVDGEGVIVNVTGSQTLVGSSNNTFTYEAKEGTNLDNYTISKVEGTLTVTDGTNPDDPKPVDDDLVVTKTHKTGTYGLGDEVEFAITATNIYDEARTITLSEIDGVTLAQSVFENVAPGETITTTATYTITEADILAQEFVNTVTAAVGNITKTATDTVTADEIDDLDGDLNVVKTVTSTGTAEGGKYKAGETVTYEITVSNDGNVTLSNIVVTDTLSNGSKVTFGEMPEGATLNADNTVSIATLAVGDEVVLTATYTVTQADVDAQKTITNVATATATDPTDEPVDPDEPTPVPVDPEEKDPHVATVKEVTSTGTAEGGKYKAGETVTYEITVTNDGNVTLTEVKVEDTLSNGSKVTFGEMPEGATLNADNSVTIAKMEVGDEVVLTATYTVTQADVDAQQTITNVATATATDPTDEPVNPDEPTPVPVDPEEKDPKSKTTKTVTSTGTGENGTYKAGETVTYEITVTNTGNVTLNDVKVEDTLSNGQGVTFDELPAGAAASGTTVTIPTLAVGETVTIKASYTVTQADVDAQETITNAVTTTAGDDELTPDDPTPVPVDPEAKDPKSKTTKTVTSTGSVEGKYKVGDVVRYEITVANTGNVTLNDVKVEDTLSNGQSVTFDELPAGATASGTTVTIPTLAVGETVTIKASYTVTQADVDAQETITNAVTTTAGDDELTPDDPTPVPVDPVPTFKVVAPEDVMYNGGEQKQAPTVTDTKTGNELTENKDYTLAYSDDVTNVGEVTVTVKGIGAYAASEPVDVKYSITPAPISFETKSAEKSYDGTALTEPSYKIVITQPTGNITIESTDELVTLLGSDTLGVDVTGTQTLVGKSNNTADLTWANGDKTEVRLSAAIANLAAANDPTAKKSNYDLSATAGTLTVTDENVPTELVVKKTHEDREYGLGETVTFELTATNIYDEARTITFIEIEGVEIEQAVWENVEPGATVTTTATYTVTEADILAGEFKNEVSVTIGDAEHGPYEDIVDIEDKDSHLTVTKTVTSTAPAGGYAAGDKITYEIVVENDGNVTISQIKVTDELTGDEWTIDALAPGEKQTFTAEYTVTDADVEKGSVKNVATATGIDPEEEEPGVTPGTTETPTAPKPALPKTGDASSLFPAVVTAAMGLMSMAAGIRSRRRRWEEEL